MSDIPTTITPTTIEPSQEQSHQSFTIPQGSDNQDYKIEPLKGFFGVKNASIEEEDAMKYIVNYFVNRNVIEMPLILLNIREIQNKLGALDVTMDRLTAVKNFIKTQAQIEMLQGEQKSMMR